MWCELVRDFLSNPNSAINNEKYFDKILCNTRGKANMKFLKNDSDLEISISGRVADKQEYKL